MTKWEMIIALCNITEMDIPGGEITETITENGTTYTRTIKKYAAIATAAKLLKAENAGQRVDRQTLDRAREILRLAKWRQGEGAIKSLPDAQP